MIWQNGKGHEDGAQKLAEREVERLTEWNNDKKYKQSPVTGTEGTKQVHLVKHRSPRRRWLRPAKAEVASWNVTSLRPMQSYQLVNMLTISDATQR